MASTARKAIVTASPEKPTGPTRMGKSASATGTPLLKNCTVSTYGPSAGNV